MTFYEPTEKEREKLGKPRGEIFEGKELLEELEQGDYSKIIAVGDRVAHDIERSEIQANIAIVDGKTQREDYRSKEEIEADRTFSAENPAGKITEEAWKAVRKASAIKSKAKVEIAGEEDLLGLPAVLFAPEDAAVVYGLRNKGAVLMKASEENKEFVSSLPDLEKSDHLIVGGSWDLFHSGHRYILLSAYERGEKIDIGVSSDEMLREKLGQKPSNTFRQRRKNIQNFMESLGKQDFRIIELNGIYGNAVEEGEDLIVTAETKVNGQKINSKRRELGRKELNLREIKKLEGEDGEIISSTRIRDNDIDKDGLET